MGVSNHGKAGLLVWDRVFSKDLRFPDPSFLSLHYSLISGTFLRICADPSRADLLLLLLLLSSIVIVTVPLPVVLLCMYAKHVISRHYTL